MYAWMHDCVIHGFLKDELIGVVMLMIETLVVLIFFFDAQYIYLYLALNCPLK